MYFWILKLYKIYHHAFSIDFKSNCILEEEHTLCDFNSEICWDLFYDGA